MRKYIALHFCFVYISSWSSSSSASVSSKIVTMWNKIDLQLRRKRKKVRNKYRRNERMSITMISLNQFKKVKRNDISRFACLSKFYWDRAKCDWKSIFFWHACVSVYAFEWAKNAPLSRTKKGEWIPLAITNVNEKFKQCLLLIQNYLRLNEECRSYWDYAPEHQFMALIRINLK